MIFQKPTTFLTKKTGVLSILIFFTISLINRGIAQDNDFRINDLRRLAAKFESNGQYLLSYIYNLSFYHLTNDTTRKFISGWDALQLCLKTKHLDEGELLVQQMLTDYPHKKNFLLYNMGYLLVLNGKFDEGIDYFDRMSDSDSYDDRINILRAYTALCFNQPTESTNILSAVRIDNFSYNKQLAEIESSLRSEPAGSKKYKSIALPLSMILPGAGQFYSGFYFDALHSFNFNLILGYAAFASWRYELGLSNEKRTYILPIFSSLVWGVFYLSNLYNAANVVDKANLSRWNSHYNGILDKFRLIIEDNSYFLKYNITLK
jgi:hypothetical protein